MVSSDSLPAVTSSDRDVPQQESNVVGVGRRAPERLVPSHPVAGTQEAYVDARQAVRDEFDATHSTLQRVKSANAQILRYPPSTVACRCRLKPYNTR